MKILLSAVSYEAAFLIYFFQKDFMNNICRGKNSNIKEGGTYMNETTKEYLRLIAEYEEKVFGYSEKIKFRDVLLEIITNDNSVLSIEEMRNAQKLLKILEKEILNYH